MEIQVVYLVSILAKIFPAMKDAQYNRFKRGIREVGLLDPIVLWRGTIIDGVHRLRACLELGVEPCFTTLPDDANPLDFVIAKNELRRNLTARGRIIAAYRASKLSRPGRRPAQENCANLRFFLTQPQAADKFGVSKASITNAAKILGPENSAIPSLRRAFLSEKVAAGDAAKIAGKPAEVQKQALELKLSGEMKTLKGAVEFIETGMVKQENTDASVSLPGLGVCGKVILHVSPVSNLQQLVEPESVDVILTFPPADAALGSTLSDLVALADYSLKRTGSMLVLIGTEYLPEFIDHLKHDELRWVCGFHYTHPGGPSNGRSSHNIPATQKLLLVFGKPDYGLTETVTGRRPLIRGAGPKVGHRTWAPVGSPVVPPGAWPRATPAADTVSRSIPRRHPRIPGRSAAWNR